MLNAPQELSHSELMPILHLPILQMRIIEAQREKEHVFTPLTAVDLSEQVGAKVRVCCSEGGHGEMECSLEREKRKSSECVSCGYYTASFFN